MRAYGSSMCVYVCVCDSKCIVRQLLGIGTVMYVYLLC